MRTHALARAGLLAGLVSGAASCLPSPCLFDDECPVGAYCKGATVVRTADGEVDDQKSTEGACTFGSNPDGTSSSSGGGGSSGVTGGSSGVTGGSSGVTGGSSGVSNGSSTMGGSSGVSGGTSAPASASSSTTTGGTSVASGGSSATNSSGVSGASSVDSSSGGSGSSASVGQSSSVAGTSSGVVGSSSVGGGSSSGVVTSSSVGAGSSSSGAVAPGTVTLDFPDRFLVLGQPDFVLRVVVTNTSASTIYLDPNPVLHIQPAAGGPDQTGYAVTVPGITGRGPLASGQSTRFFLLVSVSNGAQVPANRLVRAAVDIPWATTSSGVVDPTPLAGRSLTDLTVLDRPTASVTSTNPPVGPVQGVGQCPQVCFTVGQAQGQPVDVLVEYDNSGTFGRATQVSAAFDRPSAGTRGLTPGGTYCFAWNVPLDLPSRSADVTPSLRITPRTHGVSGAPTSSTTFTVRTSMKQCGADYHAPMALLGQRVATSALAADFDQDGQPDFLVSSVVGTNGFLNAFRGVGGGAMAPAGTQMSLSRVASLMEAGRFNGDNLSDVVTSERGFIRFYTTGSQFTFSNVASFSTASLDAQRIATGDLNGDGISEVLHIFSGAGELAMLVLNGTTIMPVTWGPLVDVRDFDVADLDQDGLDDVVAITQQMDGNRNLIGTARLEIMRGGPGAFMANAPYQPLLSNAEIGCDPEFVRVANVDGPGTPGTSVPLPDVVVLCADDMNGSREIRRFNQRGDGAFDVATPVGSVGPNGGILSTVHALTMGEFDGSPGKDLLVTTGDGAVTTTQLMTMETGSSSFAGALPVALRQPHAVDVNHDGMDDLLGLGALGVDQRALLLRRANGDYGSTSRGLSLAVLPDRLFALPGGGSTGDFLVGFDPGTNLVRYWARPDVGANVVALAGLPSGETVRDLGRGPLATGSNIVVATTANTNISQLRTYNLTGDGTTVAGLSTGVRSNPVQRVATGFHTGTQFVDAVTVSGTTPRVLQVHIGAATTITSPNTECNVNQDVVSYAIGRVGGLAVIATVLPQTGAPMNDTGYFTASSAGVNCTALRPPTPIANRNPGNMTFANSEAVFTSAPVGSPKRVHIQRLRDNSNTLVSDGEAEVWSGDSNVIRLGVHPFGQDADTDIIVQADGSVDLLRRRSNPTPINYEPALSIFAFGNTPPAAGPRTGDFNADGIMDLLWISNEAGTDVFRVAYGY